MDLSSTLLQCLHPTAECFVLGHQKILESANTKNQQNEQMTAKLSGSRQQPGICLEATVYPSTCRFTIYQSLGHRSLVALSPGGGETRCLEPPRRPPTELTAPMGWMSLWFRRLSRPWCDQSTSQHSSLMRLQVTRFKHESFHVELRLLLMGFVNNLHG